LQNLAQWQIWKVCYSCFWNKNVANFSISLATSCQRLVGVHG
jgi:hypothetical protein